jgi:hypothetical protein
MRWLLTGLTLLALAACPGGNAGVGASCGGNDDCNRALQCLNDHCAPRCARAPDCGDGYACDADGLCQAAAGQAGDRCTSEVDCAAGMSCQLDGEDTDPSGLLVASCTAEKPGRAAGAPCTSDAACRNGTCALGRCVDLCAEQVDCADGNSCMVIPHVATTGGKFRGCLPTQGTISWDLPMFSASSEVALPVPAAARAAELVMTVDDPTQKVGAVGVASPAGDRLYSAPCFPGAPGCTPEEQLDRYFANPIRHLPGFGASVLLMPSAPVDLALGVYRVQVSSFRANGLPGTAIPKVTAVLRLDTVDASTVRTLDLHFYFVNLTDHPCAPLTAAGSLVGIADSVEFRGIFLSVLRTILIHANLAVEVTTQNLTSRPDLDRLDVDDAGSLVSLGEASAGINVFFVRALSPAGLQAWAPNPGPAGVGGTRQSGIVIGLDTLCYRDWTALARLTAHEIARYMGLYHTIELGYPQHPTWRDPLGEAANVAPNNLMYFSEMAGPDGALTGAELTPGQADILRRSPVLR